MSAAIHSGQPPTLEDFRAEQTKTNAKLEQIAAILQQMKVSNLERTVPILHLLVHE